MVQKIIGYKLLGSKITINRKLLTNGKIKDRPGVTDYSFKDIAHEMVGFNVSRGQTHVVLNSKVGLVK